MNKLEYKTYLQEIGYRLKRQRIRLGLTQKELADAIAEKSDLSDKQISRFECGENGTRIDKLVELSLALGKTPDYFLLGIDKSDEEINRKVEQIGEYLMLLSAENVDLVLTFVQALVEK